MSSRFKIKDQVVVGLGIDKYGGKYNGEFGTVEKVQHRGEGHAPIVLIGVLLDKHRNPNSRYGVFWFEENDLFECEIWNKYFKNDIQVTTDLYGRCFNMNYSMKDKIKQVIFNDPATIVFWTDGSKTIVKCMEGDEFDPEKGLAMAISKKFLEGSFHREFKKWLPEEKKEVSNPISFEMKNLGFKGLEQVKEAWDNLIKQWKLKYHKFEVGDRVKVVNGQDIGREFTIRKIYPVGTQNREKISYSVVGSYPYVLYEDDIELIKPAGNPIQKAYDILVKARDDNDYFYGDFNIDDLIGLLGEALE